MQRTTVWIVGLISFGAWALDASGQAKGQTTMPESTSSNARAVFVGGDGTIGYGIFTRDLSDPNAKDTRITHLSFSKITAAGKPYEEKIPTIDRDANPRWSPDGREIAFIGGGPVRYGGEWPRPQGVARGRDDYSHVRDIWIVNEDGREMAPLVQEQIGPSGAIADVRWLPDSTRIAFIRSGHDGGPGLFNCGLYVVDVKTKKVRKLQDGGTGAEKPLIANFCWSPDGKALVGILRAGSTGDEKIAIVGMDGKQTEVTRGGECVSQPYWWPDGKITFCRGRASAEQLRNFWIMDADGTTRSAHYRGAEYCRDALWKGG